MKSSIAGLTPLISMQDEDQTLIWVKSFDDKALEAFYKQFCVLESEPTVPFISIIISSYGGEVYNQLAMRDMIKSSMKPVATIALGKAMSAGAALLASGTKGMRFCSPNTTIMVHEVSSGNWGKSSEIQTEAKNVGELNKLMLKNLAEDTGQPLEKILREIKNRNNTDWYLTAEQARKFGLIDKVSVPRIVISGAELSMVTFSKEVESKKHK